MNTENYHTFYKLFKAKASQLLAESEAQDGQADLIPYTQEDEMLASIMETARVQFGADFTDYPNPLLYDPSNNNVIFHCAVGDLNDAKVEFRLKDDDGTGHGCRLWADNLCLTKDSISKMQTVWGVYDNWVRELRQNSDIKPLSLNGTSDAQLDNSMPGDGPGRQVRPGDDY